MICQDTDYIKRTAEGLIIKPVFIYDSESDHPVYDPQNKRSGFQTAVSRHSIGSKLYNLLLGDALDVSVGIKTYLRDQINNIN